MDPRADSPTVDQIRHAIDQGRGADKVAFPDPATVPLGTDEEAGGTPPSAAERAQAARHEVGDHHPAPDRAKNPRASISSTWLGIGVGALAAVALGGLLISALG
jgi:hypothetical protein